MFLVFKTIIFLKIIILASADKKGAFKLTTVSAEPCREVSKPYKNVDFNMKMGSNRLISINFTTKADIGPITGILSAYRYVGAKKIKMFSYTQKPICTFKAILKAWPVKLNFDDKCILKPMDYHTNDLDLDSVVQKLTGSKFFYGKYLFNYVWESPTETLCCGEYIFKFIPSE